MPTQIVNLLIEKVDSLKVEITELRTEVKWIKKIGYMIGGAAVTALAKLFIGA